jgi:glycolate oxidase FAD binding subunit
VSTVTESGAIERELASVAGEAWVSTGDSEAFEINGIRPAWTVAPGSAEEVAAILRIANERDLVVAPAGGSTKQQVGGIPERIDILLRLERLNQIAHYDPGDLTIGVEAGIRFSEMQRALTEHQQWIPLDAPFSSAASKPKAATIGGLLATASFGPLKSGFGGLRDFCIGLQFVTSDGKIAKGGGRVVKNVAGYDLMKLMIGSFGSLAIITKANFKVFPAPRQTCTFICSFPSLPEALKFRDFILKSPLTPICLEIISPQAPEYLCDPPTPRDPDDYAPLQPVAQPPSTWHIALRATGSDSVLGRFRRELGEQVARELEGGDESQYWSWVAHFEYSILARHRNAMVVYTHVSIQNAGPAIEALQRVAPDYNFVPAMVGRVATGNLIMGFIPLAVGPPSAMEYANCASAFRSLLPAGSSGIVRHCPKEAKRHFDVWGSSPSDLNMMQAVKDAMDPKKILNRGRFIV